MSLNRPNKPAPLDFSFLRQNNARSVQRPVDHATADSVQEKLATSSPIDSDPPFYRPHLPPRKGNLEDRPAWVRWKQVLWSELTATTRTDLYNHGPISRDLKRLLFSLPTTLIDPSHQGYIRRYIIKPYAEKVRKYFALDEERLSTVRENSRIELRTGWLRLERLEKVQTVLRQLHEVLVDIHAFKWEVYKACDDMTRSYDSRKQASYPKFRVGDADEEVVRTPVPWNKV